MRILEHVLEYSFAGDSLRTWLFALLVGCLVWIGGTLVRQSARKVSARADARSPRWQRFAARVVSDLRGWLVAALAVHAAAQMLVAAAPLQDFTRGALGVALTLQLLVVSRHLIDFWLECLTERRTRADGSSDPAIQSAAGIIRAIALLVVAAMLALLLLSNFGIEIAPLIAGLGIGGIAVALAAQSVLGDLFGSVTILFDRPFLVGDFIIVGDKMGTVEHIGIKTTRVRALTGEQIVFSNAALLAHEIRNYRRMHERRVELPIRVAQDTPVTALSTLPSLLREAVEASPGTRFDRAHFKAFGEYSLDFELVFYVLSPDYNEYMDIQQAINLHVVRGLRARGVRLARPLREITSDTPAVAGAVPAGGA
ncbi:MAG: mechanosensitive ion channel family protein [Gammaproteobacteria bacterium]